MNINQKRSKITKSILKRYPELEPLQQLSKVAKELKKFQMKCLIIAYIISLCAFWLGCALIAGV